VKIHLSLKKNNKVSDKEEKNQEIGSLKENLF
jgi:hypothetical protein